MTAEKMKRRKRKREKGSEGVGALRAQIYSQRYETAFTTGMVILNAGEESPYGHI
ncbi:hypothetical protein [Dialister sp.]|uniref:hypothetical protein n=1 Tax=Dialister sp. TaxID=1955814 RepID=UPI003F024E63